MVLSGRLYLEQELKAIYSKYADVLLATLRREFSTIIARLHRVDFSKLTDPMADGMGDGPSPYLVELTAKMTFVRTEILAPYNIGTLKKEW